MLLPCALTGCGEDSPATPSEGVVAAEVDVRTSSALRVVEPGLILGGNMAAWVASGKLNPPTDGYVGALGSGILRFPGGNLSNSYCWVTERASDKDLSVWSDWSWGTNVEQYLAFVRRVGCAPMYSVNPFDHTIDGERHFAADEARALVRRFLDRGFAGAYYEVGNENDGTWNPMLSVDEYAERYVLIADSIKSEDPSARMIGPVASGYSREYVDGFIDRIAARGRLDLLDLVSYHTYGGWIANDNSNLVNLSHPQSLGPEIQVVRAKLESVGAGHVGVAVTEYNAAIWAEGCDRDKFSIRQALWLVDYMGELFRHADMGNVWITLHPGQDPHSLIDDQSAPPRRTRNYWPCLLVRQTLVGDDPGALVSVLETVTELPSSRLTAHATLRGDNGVGVLLINKSRESILARLSVRERGNCGGATASLLDEPVYQAGNGPSSVAMSCSGDSLSVTLPGLSVVGVVVP
jgi:hypothetical protein